MKEKKFPKAKVLRATELWAGCILDVMHKERGDTELWEIIDAIGCKIMPQLLRVGKDMREERIQ